MIPVRFSFFFFSFFVFFFFFFFLVHERSRKGRDRSRPGEPIPDNRWQLCSALAQLSPVRARRFPNSFRWLAAAQWHCAKARADREQCGGENRELRTRPRARPSFSDACLCNVAPVARQLLRAD